jgi:hypothetical protein
MLHVTGLGAMGLSLPRLLALEAGIRGAGRPPLAIFETVP